MATYRSISCELLADAAVLPGISNGPFLRFTPYAAQRRFESTCGESFLSLISRIVLLCCNAFDTDVLRPFVDLGSSSGGRFCEKAENRRPEPARESFLFFLSIIISSF